MANDGYTQIQQLLETFAEVQDQLRLYPAIGSTADANKFVRVAPDGMSYVLDSFSLSGMGVASRTLTLTAGSGLSGGGDLTANRSFALDIAGLSAIADGDIAIGDRLPVYDASGTTNVRYTFTQVFKLFNSLSTLATLDSADRLIAWDDSAGEPVRLAATQLLAGAKSFTLEAYETSRTGASGLSVPSTLISYLAFTTGGGGGGGRAISSTSNYAAAGGGGSGGTSLAMLTAASVNAALNSSSKLDITIGTAGSGATGSQTKGGNGGATIIGPVATPLLSSSGGTGGSSATNAFGSGGAGAAAGSNGTVTVAGRVGGFGLQPKASGLVIGGEGASSFWGGGARSTISTTGNTAGAAGNAPGSGGGGGVSFTSATGANGGAGKAGIVVLLGFHKS